jgi:sulfur carrier protein ThiS
VKVKARITRSNITREIDMNTGSKVFNILEKLHIKPDTTIVIKHKSPIPIDDDLNEGDDLTIILVSSGG